MFYETNGGEGYLVPEPNRPARIKVGLNSDWNVVVETLIHEAFELCMARMGMSYKRSNWITSDSSDHTFIFDHVQFTQLCGVVGNLLVKALPELAKLYKEAKKLKGKTHERTRIWK